MDTTRREAEDGLKSKDVEFRRTSLPEKSKIALRFMRIVRTKDAEIRRTHKLEKRKDGSIAFIINEEEQRKGGQKVSQPTKTEVLGSQEVGTFLGEGAALILLAYLSLDPREKIKLRFLTFNGERFSYTTWKTEKAPDPGFHWMPAPQWKYVLRETINRTPNQHISPKDIEKWTFKLSFKGDLLEWRRIGASVEMRKPDGFKKRLRKIKSAVQTTPAEKSDSDRSEISLEGNRWLLDGDSEFESNQEDIISVSDWNHLVSIVEKMTAAVLSGNDFIAPKVESAPWIELLCQKLKEQGENRKLIIIGPVSTTVHHEFERATQKKDSRTKPSSDSLQLNMTMIPLKSTEEEVEVKYGLPNFQFKRDQTNGKHSGSGYSQFPNAQSKNGKRENLLKEGKALSTDDSDSIALIPIESWLLIPDSSVPTYSFFPTEEDGISPDEMKWRNPKMDKATICSAERSEGGNRKVIKNENDSTSYLKICKLEELLQAHANNISVFDTQNPLLVFDMTEFDVSEYLSRLEEFIYSLPSSVPIIYIGNPPPDCILRRKVTTRNTMDNKLKPFKTSRIPTSIVKRCLNHRYTERFDSARPSGINSKKQMTRDEDHRYLLGHPELLTILETFTECLMQVKPTRMEGFAAEYFKIMAGMKLQHYTSTKKSNVP